MSCGCHAEAKLAWQKPLRPNKEVWAPGPLILFRVMLQSGNENFEPVLDSPHGHPYLRLR